MPGVSLTYDFSAVSRLNDRLARLTRSERRDLLELIGGLVEDQIRRRISEEKESPDGEKWAPWSERHAATRHGGHSLLEAEGHLLDSIQYVVTGDSVETGSNLVYAAVHQFGSGDDPVNVPAHKRLVTQAFGKSLPFGVWADVGPYSFMQNIPERPYLGLSGSNEAELIEEVDRFLDHLVMQ